MKKIILTLLLAACTNQVSWGSIVYVDLNQDATGTRSEANDQQVTTIGNWLNNGQTFLLDWDIRFDGSKYTYQYTISGESSPNISHFSIATSDGREGTTIFTSANVLAGSDSGITVGQLNDAKFGAPTDIYGLKFDFGTDDPSITYTLVTDRAPIWGSFFAKAGSATGAYNVGWSTTLDGLADYTITPGFPTSFSKDNWIPVPDSHTTNPVPEPATLALWSVLGLVGLGYGVRRRLNNKA